MKGRRKRLTRSAKRAWVKGGEGRNSALAEVLQVAAVAVAALEKYGVMGCPASTDDLPMPNASAADLSEEPDSPPPSGVPLADLSRLSEQWEREAQRDFDEDTGEFKMLTHCADELATLAARFDPLATIDDASEGGGS